ncbi:MAG: polysaccharide deacetylase family protein, partial [Caldilineaceae bacterium]|nr:polysaccharide deacetylase family protein [Caldilineaceae bacterium]
MPPNAVAITFDDGTIDNFELAFPVLKRMEFPAVIFMITDNIGKPGWLTEEDLKILDQ